MTHPTQPVHDEAAILEAFQSYQTLMQRCPQLKDQLTFGQYYLSQDLTIMSDELETLTTLLTGLGSNLRA